VSTTRELVVDQKYVIRTPSKQAIRKRILKSYSLPGFEIKPGYLYTVVRAISARVNQNFDGWPSNELREAAHTFVGKPVFVNHENYDPNEARGVVVASRYIENGRDKYIEVVQEIDAQRFPLLANEIKTGGLDSVSMGAEAGFTICSACGNKAQDMEDMCYHVLAQKGERINIRNKKTGKMEQKLVYESCHKLSFFELSYVFDPADETAVASKVIVGKRKHIHGAECPPGQTCETEQMSKARGDSPIYDGSGGSSGGGTTSGGGAGVGNAIGGGELGDPAAAASSSGGVGDDGIMDISRGLHDALEGLDPADNEIGGYRPGGDGFDEHNNGALDYMTTDPAVAEQVKSTAFENGAPYVIWQQQMHYPDGRTEPMEDRGDPTQNHMDHVHTGPLQDRAAGRLVRALRTAGLHDFRKADYVSHTGVITASFKKEVRDMIMKRAWGEIEAPQAVDTLREEGSAPEDDNDDFHHYVESPDELSMPDLSQANQLDREQAEDEQQGMGPNPEAMGNPNGGGVPGPAEGGGPVPPAGPVDTTEYMTLKIPIPGTGGAAGAPPPQVPMQTFALRGAMSGHELAWMERYYGHRVANWWDAITAGRDLTPEEKADFNREAALWTLEKMSAESGSSRNTVKGTANMAQRSTLATRRKTAGTSHFAEGPHTDGGPFGRNDQGEQEEIFITETPAEEEASTPKDGQEISNTEDNLVADEAYAKSLTAKLAQQKRELEATAREYARIAGRTFKADGSDAGGPVATEVNPTVQDSASEELTGDHFESADPNADAQRTDPGAKESSLRTFQVFDRWLTASTGKSARQHSPKNIDRAARQFAAYNKIKVESMYPALGLALRQARKVEAEKKGQPVRKKAVDLETAAPDDRISVPAPVSNTNPEESQDSQFDEKGYANNAGDDLADPDLSTGQNFAPGQAPNKSAAKADGILAIRCAEAMIAAGLEQNTRERKYQLAAQFEKMSRGLIMDRTALAERFAMVRQADHERVAQKVASGRTRGTASPVPPGISQGGTTSPRTAGRVVAANDPSNDSLMFG
jgi:hypothetical protein